MNRYRILAGVVMVGLVLAVVQLPARSAPANSAAGAAAEGVDPECALAEGPYLHEGPTDWTQFPKPEGTLRAIMLFVDFPDAPATDSSQALYDLLVPDAEEWFDEASYGRMNLEVTPIHEYFRMPKESGEYRFSRGLTTAEHIEYITDAVAAADGSVDFRGFDLFYIVPTRNATKITYSPAFVHGRTGYRIPNDDGASLGWGATFGQDVHADRWEWRILLHETGHALSLPDLYAYEVATDDHLGLHPSTGAWDPMGDLRLGSHMFAWHKAKLGWLQHGEVRCVTTSAPVTETLNPLSSKGGTKAIVVKTGPSTAIVAENRQQLRNDSELCEEGLLVYSVDTRVATGEGPIQVHSAQPPDESLYSECGTFNNAPFDISTGEISTFEDADLGVRISVTGDDGGSLQVRAEFYGGPPGEDVDPPGSDPAVVDQPDTTAPEIAGLKVAPDPFTPNGDGAKDKTKVRFTTDEVVSATVLVKNGRGVTVKTLALEEALPGGAQRLVWNGRKDSGKKARGGTYLIEVSLADDVGNVAMASATVKLKR